jgi:hypothetical protein
MNYSAPRLNHQVHFIILGGQEASGSYRKSKLFRDPNFERPWPTFYTLKRYSNFTQDIHINLPRDFI